MSPTVFTSGPFRFYFFSREEPRMHVHVQSSSGEAKIWLEPTIEIAEAHRLTSRQKNRIRRLVEEHQDEIRKAWQEHFGR